MKLSKLLTFAVGASATPPRPPTTSVCDYYTTLLLTDNNATNQETLVTLLVNTAVIGNYTNPSSGLAVPGILSQNATYNNTAVNLLPYFNGDLASTNTGGSAGVSVNFLDDGGATPLLQNKPANGTSSNQYKLMTHLYSYFALLLGCTQYGNSSSLPAYAGQASMYQVHKFMALDAYEVQYFIEQVGLSALSFGVTVDDAELVGHALQVLFGYRCAAEAAVVPGGAEQLQSVCIADDCPLAANATCSVYATVMEPKHVNGSVVINGTAVPSSITSATATSTKKSSEELTRKVCVSLVVVFALGSTVWLL